MDTRTRKRFLVSPWMMLALCLYALPLRAEEIQAIETIQPEPHLGGGASISSDGQRLVYVGKGGLHLREVSTKRDRVLIDRVGPLMDVFRNPVFGNDGEEVFVSASGGTYYYPSGIYSIRLDTASVRPLTTTEVAKPSAAGNAVYKRYYYSPHMSPTSSTLLMGVYDAVQRTENIGLLDGTTSRVKILAQGRPLAWNADGSALYYSDGEKLMSLDLESRKSYDTQIQGRVIGKLADTTFVIDDLEEIKFVSLRHGKPVWRKSNIPRLVQFGVPQFGQEAHQMTLQSLQSSNNGLVLLIYQEDSGEQERLELVRLTSEN